MFAFEGEVAWGGYLARWGRMACDPGKAAGP